MSLSSSLPPGHQPSLMVHTSLWDSRQVSGRRALGLSALRRSSFNPMLSVCSWIRPRRREQERVPAGQALLLCGRHRNFFPKCKNCWILCSEARTHLEQLSQNPLKAKGQASCMGSFVGLYKTAPTIPCLRKAGGRRAQSPGGMVGTR